MKTKVKRRASPDAPVPRGGLAKAVRDLVVESPEHLAVVGLSKADTAIVVRDAEEETARNPGARGTEATLKDGRKVSIKVQYPPK